MCVPSSRSFAHMCMSFSHYWKMDAFDQMLTNCDYHVFRDWHACSIQFKISLAFLLMSVFFIIFVADKSFFANTQPASRFSSSAVRYLPLFANLPLVDVDLAKQICIIHRFMNHTDCKHVIHWDEVAQVI